jgi:precorrin-6B methylase 1
MINFWFDEIKTKIALSREISSYQNFFSKLRSPITDAKWTTSHSRNVLIDESNLFV